MKRSSALVFVLLLLVGAAALAAPAPIQPEAPAADQEAIPYTGLLEAPADCAVTRPVSASFDPGICSPQCAQVICKNKPVNSPCGFGGGGPQRYCYEEPIVCSDGPACRCTNVPP